MEHPANPEPDLVDGSVDLSYFSSVAVQEEQEHIGALVSTFESPPSFGAAFDINGWRFPQAATLLMYYPQSLPQQILPPDVAMKLVHLNTLTWGDFTVSRYHPMLTGYLATLQALPRADSDTVLSLRIFLRLAM
jgi:hypothetical protein